MKPGLLRKCYVDTGKHEGSEDPVGLRASATQGPNQARGDRERGEGKIQGDIGGKMGRT